MIVTTNNRVFCAHFDCGFAVTGDINAVRLYTNAVLHHFPGAAECRLVNYCSSSPDRPTRAIISAITERYGVAATNLAMSDGLFYDVANDSIGGLAWNADLDGPMLPEDGSASINP
jgi:hypothetical protein